MPEEINVGKADSMIRILLGIIVLVSVVYHFAFASLFSIYVLIPMIILIPFFLKTGITRVCPIMKSMNIKTT